MINHKFSRRRFIRKTAWLAGGMLTGSLFGKYMSRQFNPQNNVKLSGHLWVYASKYPPDWDCTPILEQVFRDFQYAGLSGIEVMESILRHDDVVPRVSNLIQKYDMPITGTSYYADMWNSSQSQQILDDVSLVVQRLHDLGGSTFGITVGDAGRKKTESELDVQAELLKEIMLVCDQYDVVPNLHNHTFELAHDMHDLLGTMERVPELKLGPDINWLIRGGVDPVHFIEKYGDRIIYLHIRDQYSDGTWSKVVGDGVTDFPAIADALKEKNFSGRAAIELAFEEPPTGPVTEEWKKSRVYVKEIFGW